MEKQTNGYTVCSRTRTSWHLILPTSTMCKSLQRMRFDYSVTALGRHWQGWERRATKAEYVVYFHHGSWKILWLYFWRSLQIRGHKWESSCNYDSSQDLYYFRFISLIYMSVLPVCMYSCMYITCMPATTELRRLSMPWNWSYRWF